MSGFTLSRLAALAVLIVTLVHAQDGRIIDQKTLFLDETLRKEIGARREFTSAFKSAAEIFAVIDKVDMREITYLSDGLKVKGFILAPKKEGRYPVLIWNRGGCRESIGVLTRYSVARWLSPFASWGYVVVASQYRGAAGGEGKDEFGGADLNDVLNLFPLLDSVPKADTSRIGMAGFSRGGLMTYLALTKTKRIKAAIVGSAFVDVDFRSDASRRKELGLPEHGLREYSRLADDLEDFCLRQVVPNYDQNRQKIIDARSPIRWPEKLHREVPILILHGTSDWDVLAYGPLDMAAAFLKLKHPFRLLMFGGRRSRSRSI